MADIKTCEQYVLDRLEKTEQEIDDLQEKLATRDYTISTLMGELAELKAFIFRRARFASATDGDERVTFDDPWLKYDPEDYEYISKILKEQEKED